MGKLTASNIRVPFEHNLKCPVCDELLDIVVVTRLDTASAQVSGRDGLGRATSIPVHISSTPVSLTIQEHVCPIDLGE